MKKILLVLLVFVLIGIAAAYWYLKNQTVIAITNFEECGQAGYPIMESYPAQCRTPDGRTFVQDIGNELEKQDMIRIEYPRPSQKINRDLTVTGQARGPWFFEASFPISLEDKEGNRLGVWVAQAEGEWMTEEFVPFLATISIPKTFSGPANLILEKDNPSGLPENADRLIVPVFVE